MYAIIIFFKGFFVGMGKKKTKGHRKASRSDKRMQKLYADAIKEVKKRNINLDDLPPRDSEDIDGASEELEDAYNKHANTQKARKKAERTPRGNAEEARTIKKAKSFSFCAGVKARPFQTV